MAGTRNSLAYGAAAMLALACTAGKAEPPTALDLVCEGQGYWGDPHAATSEASLNGEHRRRGASAARLHSTAPQEYRIHIRGRSGRIRMPRETRRFLTNVPIDGWLPLTGLKVATDKITGRFDFSFATRPRVSVDRATGEMIISGWGYRFVGVCRPAT